VVVTFVDLTVLKLAEAEQRERDARFREVFDHAPTGIGNMSLDGLLVKCNPAFCKIVGYPEEELLGLHSISLVHPDDQAGNKEALRTLTAGEVSAFEIENRYVHKNGSFIPVHKLVSTIPDGTGKAVSLMALVTDISVQRKALEALRQSEERSRAILKTASDTIITINNRGIIDSVNESTETIFGYASSEMVGQNVSMLMPLPFNREHDGYIQRFIHTGEPHIIGNAREVLCRRKDGTTFPADLAVSQVDHLGLFTGILRDFTSREEMQQHILDIANEEQQRIFIVLLKKRSTMLCGMVPPNA